MAASRLLTVTYSLLCAAAIPGCGDGRPTRVPVSGKVLIDGKVLAYGAVRFTPEHGRPATGEIQKDGTFAMSTFEPNDGVVPGTHTVTVHAREDLSGTQVRWNAPKKYGNPAQSGLRQIIEKPTDSITIELTWGGQPGPFVETIRRGGGE
jgi:hypothetical protein